MIAEMRMRARTVRKRDGSTVQDFDPNKIERAIRSAWEAVDKNVDTAALNVIAGSAVLTLPSGTVDVETVQDAVEVALMRHGYFTIAKAYILYRQKRAEERVARDRKPDPKAISDYIHASKYARYQLDLGRRETYLETVARNEGMHLRRFPPLEGEIRHAYDLVREQRLLPSMRSMQFAGEAIEVNHNRMYNCCATLVDRLEVFSEALFLLLSGSGVGYSVQFEHVDKLPTLVRIDEHRIRHHIVGDSIEGWADALKALVHSYTTGEYVEFAYNKVRSAGAVLRVSGGKAPGHVPLKLSLERIRAVLDGAQGRKLRPIECHRIICHAADAVLSGGIRRSAMIALFSLDDSEMMNCKTGDWFPREPWLQNANNSVVLDRKNVSERQFKRIFQMTKQWGEPGFYFTADINYVTNPCCEIGLYPILTVTLEIMEALKKRGIDTAHRIGDKVTGWAFCNLCEINAAKLTSFEDFVEVARAATFIGTLQAAYTDMPYLGWVSEEIAKRDALLGIGMTGMLDAPAIACNPIFQQEIAGRIKQWNIDFAARIGVSTAARTTTVKPSGTTSLELGCVGSGHHPHHAKRYIRRVTADRLETVFQAFRDMNPHMCVKKPDGKWVIEFPVKASDDAIVKADLGAIEFLDMVRSTQTNWVRPGTARADVAPGLSHNVSNTAVVREGEWDTVADYLWEHREAFTGVSLVPATSDKDYAFAPCEEIVTETDEARWNELLASYKPLDYATLRETSDETNLTGEVACAGGACAI